MYITFQASIVPLFLIFLDAVHQLIEQFPSVFGTYVVNYQGYILCISIIPPLSEESFFSQQLDT